MTSILYGPQSWTCQFCNRDTTLNTDDYDVAQIICETSLGKDQLVQIATLRCPNGACREHEIFLLIGDSGGSYFDQVAKASFQQYLKGSPISNIRVRPRSGARPMPDYIPAAIREDYVEACLIESDSPKASATLSRRAIQGMIRDFWKIKDKRTLYDEIEALKGLVDPVAWDAIDAVRSLGNIGAHMEKDINIIVDVDPGESRLLIQLIETLIREWYVARHEREVRFATITSAAAQKKAAITAARAGASEPTEAGE